MKSDYGPSGGGGLQFINMSLPIQTLTIQIWVVMETSFTPEMEAKVSAFSATPVQRQI